MVRFQLDKPYLLQQILNDASESLCKDRANRRHNHKILFGKLKQLRNEATLIQSEKVQKKNTIRNQIQAEYNIIATNIEEVKHQTKIIIEETSKCKQDIATEELNLIKAKESCSKAKLYRSNLNDAKREREEELKSIWSALLKSTHYFKQRLQCFLEIESAPEMSGVFHLFSNEKTDKYYVRLTLKDSNWSFSELTPELSQHTGLAQTLAATNDVIGFLVCVKKLFKEHSSKRQLKNKGK